jgi:pimeloyl-ACP methyl ester carboxylesterase
MPNKPRMGGVLAALALVFAAAIAAGIGYEQVERRRENERLPRIGRAVDIGGRALNIYCSGEGSPAVVLESDAFAPGYSWVFIQREIAKTTRACWYDRAGYGWSDPGPAPRTSVRTAADLRLLLRAAGVAPPYLLVGDRFGGFNVRAYTGLYPDDVGGVVLVDPINEDQERMGIAGRIPLHLGYPPDLVLRTVSRIGLMRLFRRGNRHRPPARGLTDGERATLAGLETEPKMRAAFLAEQGFSASLEEMRAAPGLGDRPLVLLWSKESLDGPTQPGAEAASLAHLSTRSRQIVVKESDRDIQDEAPDAIVESVREVVQELRKP